MSSKRYFFVSVETTGTAPSYAGDYTIETDNYPNRDELIQNIIQTMYESHNIPEGTPIDMVFRTITELSEQDYESWTGKKLAKPKKAKKLKPSSEEPVDEKSPVSP